MFWHLPEPYPVEVLNDLDQRIVNLYRVLQDRDKFRELLRRLIWTPYSRAEFARALATLKDPGADDVSRAWAFLWPRIRALVARLIPLATGVVP